MRVFLTGGTGFIGSHLTALLLSSGHYVKSLKRKPGLSRTYNNYMQPEWIEKPLDEVAASDLDDIDLVMHLAAHTPNPPYDELKTCLRWNVMAPLQLFYSALRAGVKKYVITGSCFEYGLAGANYDFIPTNAPLEPTLTYAASKAAASIAFVQWGLSHGVSLSILRLFQVYGKGELATRLWPSLCKAAEEGKDFPMTRGEQIRDFLNVEDVVRHILGEAESINKGIVNGVSVSNLGSGKPMSLLDFAASTWSQLNAKGCLRPGTLPYREGEMMRYVPLLGRHTIQFPWTSLNNH